MASRPFDARIEGVLAEFEPASPIGAEIVRSYTERIRRDGSAATRNDEIMLLRDLCAMAARTPLHELSVAAIEALNDPPADTEARHNRRAKALRRVIRIFQADGFLPSARDLRYNRKLRALLSRLAPAARPNLERWLARRHGVCTYELFHEARRLAVLEDVLAEQPGLHHADAIAAWLERLVRPIVDCPCPPLTRARDPLTCASCGASAATHETRPSPGPAKQAELRSLGMKYLSQRQPHTASTRYA